MPTLNIGGRRVKVDDSFLSMSPDQQNAAVEEIAKSLPQTQQAPKESPDQPWYAQLGQAADDMARLAANGATFGYADKLAGYLNGDGTEAERERTEAASDRAGSAGTVAELGGAIATPVGLAGRGVTLAGRLGTGAMKGVGGLAARSGLMGAEGAGYGALTAAGNDQDIGKGAILGALTGGAGNVAGEAISSGVSKAAGAFNKKPAIPSTGDIETAKQAAYKAADDAGVIFTPKAVDRLHAKVSAQLADLGYDPTLQPGAGVVFKRLEDLRGKNITLGGLDTIRKVASNGYVPGNKANNKAISDIIEAIDEVIANPAQGEILMGNAQAGAKALQEARSLASRSAKLGRVDQALKKADLRAASTGSGGNVDNATRQNLRRLLENPRGFSPDERSALEAIVRGTPGQNALRLAGKLSPSGNGLMAALGVGGAMVNPAIGAASLGGMGAKAIADALTGKNVRQLTDVIAAGGSRAATQAPPNAVQRLAEAKRQAIIHAIMGGGVNLAVAP